MATNHYIRQGATGSADGSDWDNAFTDLPASFIRGDTYYVADGTYGGHTFNTAVSGTTLITIKKATIGDHGTQDGWSNAYGDGQAEFTSQLRFDTAYWHLDGQVGGGPGSWTTGFGFKVTTTSAAGKLIYVTASNVTVEHCDLEHRGVNTNVNDDCVYLFNTFSDFTLRYCYLHDVNRVHILAISITNSTVEYCYFARRGDASDPYIHGEAISWNNSVQNSNVVIRYCLFRDVEGTGFIVVKDGNQGGFEIYGNVFWQRPGEPNIDAITNGVICNTGGDTNSDMKVHHNTFVDIPETLAFGAIGYSGSGTGNEAYNNIFINMGTYSISDTHDYNLFDDATAAGGETNGQNYAGALTDLFTDYNNDDFSLKIATDAGDVLAPTYDTDLNGNLRGSDGTWDRGAYEYVETPTGVVLVLA